MKIIITNFSGFLGISNPFISDYVKQQTHQLLATPIYSLQRKLRTKLDDIIKSRGASVSAERNKTMSEAVSEGIQKKNLSGDVSSRTRDSNFKHPI